MSNGRLQPNAPADRNLRDQLTATRILAAVSEAADVSPAAIVGQSKRAEVAVPRQLFLWMLYHHMGWGIRHISREVGRSPSTVYQAVRDAEFHLTIDRHMIRTYSRVLGLLCNHPTAMHGLHQSTAVR